MREGRDSPKPMVTVAARYTVASERSLRSLRIRTARMTAVSTGTSRSRMMKSRCISTHLGTRRSEGRDPRIRPQASLGRAAGVHDRRGALHIGDRGVALVVFV